MNQMNLIFLQRWVPFEEDDRFNVARLGEHIQGLNPHDAISEAGQRPQVPGQGGGIAGHVNDLRGIQGAQGGECIRFQTDPRRIDESHIHREALPNEPVPDDAGHVAGVKNRRIDTGPV